MLLTFCWPSHTWTLKVFIWFWFCSWFIECILHSLFYTLSLSLLSISISLLPYLYMSRLRSLDLKNKKNGGNSAAWPRCPLTTLPYTPRACTDEGIRLGPNAQAHTGGRTHPLAPSRACLLYIIQCTRCDRKRIDVPKIEAVKVEN